MSLVATTRSETAKLTTTASWWILAIVLVAYIGMSAAALAFVIGATASGLIGADRGAMPTDGVAPLLYSLAASVGYVFPLLIGTLIVTTEFRHKTLTPTFLATPQRGRVLTAKMIVGVGIGLVYAVLALIATVGPVAGILAAFGIGTGLGTGDAWAQFGRILIAFALWALIGVGVGALLRNQVAAIVVVLVFTQFVGPILQVAGSFVDGLATVTRYLPGAASDALVGSSILSASGPSTGGDGLEWWLGGIVLAAYALVFLVAGHLFSWRRDVS